MANSPLRYPSAGLDAAPGSRSALLAAPARLSPSLPAADADSSGSSGAGAGQEAEAEDGDVIRVLLADDHVMVRSGICSLLRFMDDVEVVGQASSGHEALGILQSRQESASASEPTGEASATDIAILDISMAGMNGLETAAHIAARHPQTRVLMLSMHDSEEYVLQALRVGASGYLLKESSANELELAVRTVAQGGIYLSPGVSRHSRHLVASYFSGQDTPAAIPEPPAQPKPAPIAMPTATPTAKPHAPQAEAVTLTSRQQEILRLLSQGLSNGQIAKQLSISVKTVESHRSQLMSRLGIFDIAGLVRYAIRHGFAEPL